MLEPIGPTLEHKFTGAFHSPIVQGNRLLQDGESIMSPHAQQSFVNDLVQMARAYEELPRVQEELRDTQERLNSAMNTIQRLEMKLLDRANEITDNLRKINGLEVSVTSAELRFLEAEDRTEKALAFVRSAFGNAGQLLQALEPPKPEPKAEEPRAVDFTSAHTETSSKTAAASDVQPVESHVTEAVNLPLSEVGLNVSSLNPAAEAPDIGSTSSSGVSGESAADPTSAHTQDSPQTQAVPLQDAGDALTAEKPSTKGPYSGKRYHDHPYYVTLQGWLDGGGTEVDYNWRPSSVA